MIPKSLRFFSQKKFQKFQKQQSCSPLLLFSLQKTCKNSKKKKKQFKFISWPNTTSNFQTSFFNLKTKTTCQTPTETDIINYRRSKTTLQHKRRPINILFKTKQTVQKHQLKHIIKQAYKQHSPAA